MTRGAKSHLAAASFGATAPFWWPWSIGQASLLFHAVLGSPERVPSYFKWLAIYLPCALLGLLSGVAMGYLDPRRALALWMSFVTAFVLVSLCTALWYQAPLSIVLTAFQTSANLLFWASMLLPLVVLALRKRAL